MNRTSIALALVGLTASLSASAQDAPNLFWGSPVPVAQAQRSIVIAPDTRWVNVAQGEAIRFVAGGVEFGWKFDGLGARSFDLRQVAPSGALLKAVPVYITANAGDRR